MTSHEYSASTRLPTQMKTGTAASWVMTQKAMTAGSERSYRIPIAALPMNQKIPYPAVKVPNADARQFSGTIGATAAGMINSCTPIPSPQIAAPMSDSQKPPRNTRGAKSAHTSVSATKTTSRNRSKSLAIAIKSEVMHARPLIAIVEDQTRGCRPITTSNHQTAKCPCTNS